MSKLLTIAVSTYNHDSLLDSRLAWLASELKGLEQDCEIIVCDNCSDDKTPGVLAKWRWVLTPQVSFTYHSNEEHISPMANTVSSLRKANGTFVWAIRDDDKVQSGTIAYLLSKIKAHSDLSVVLLNGAGQHSNVIRIDAEKYFSSVADPQKPDRAAEFKNFLEGCVGEGLSISFAAYRTKLIKNAFLSWPNSAEHIASQAYWIAFCAARGSVVAALSLDTKSVMTSEFSDTEDRRKFMMTFCGFPDVYLRLMRLGYPKAFCLSMIFRNLRSKDSWRIFFGSLRRWPIFTARGFVYYVRDIVVASWLFLVKNSNPELLEEVAKLG